MAHGSTARLPGSSHRHTIRDPRAELVGKGFPAPNPFEVLSRETYGKCITFSPGVPGQRSSRGKGKSASNRLTTTMLIASEQHNGPSVFQLPLQTQRHRRGCGRSFQVVLGARQPARIRPYRKRLTCGTGRSTWCCTSVVRGIFQLNQLNTTSKHQMPDFGSREFIYRIPMVAMLHR